VTFTLSANVAAGGGVPPEKLAVTATGEVPTETVHSAPEALVQPVQKTKPPAFAGVAVRVTGEFGTSFAVHVCPESQPMPPPETVPLPLTVTDSGTSSANVAVTERDVSICTVQVACSPEQAPPQPVNA
jgi:hypothetical protein